MLELKCQVRVETHQKVVTNLKKYHKQEHKTKQTKVVFFYFGMGGLLILALVALVLCTPGVKGSCDPLPCDALPDNGNGQQHALPRVGSLGGIVDDFLQDYRGHNGNVIAKPDGALTTAQVVAKYGSIENWNLQQVTRIDSLFAYKTTFNFDISSWNIARVVSMVDTFMQATSFDQVLCSSLWVDLTAQGKETSFSTTNGGSIAANPCNCNPGKYLTIDTPPSCVTCGALKYQDEISFTGPGCKSCGVGNYLFSDKTRCLVNVVEGNDPLPSGDLDGTKWSGDLSASERVGTIGGVIDDFFQDYSGMNPTTWIYEKVDPPTGSMSLTQVIQKYGGIGKKLFIYFVFLFLLDNISC